MRRSGFKYVVLIILAMGTILIHVNSYMFPYSVLVRHVILFLFIAVGCYLAYESRRRQQEEYNKLRQFLRVCAWCKKISVTDTETGEEKWLGFEEYMSREHKSTSSHGICPACFQQMNKHSDKAAE